MSVYGVSLEGVAPHHLSQFDIYKKKEESPSRKKEVQSSKKFYIECSNTQDEALKWKEIHAPCVNVSCIIATIKTLENFTNLKLHRICKTAYPLYVWMGHNKVIFRYLESFRCFAVNEQAEGQFFGNPFTEARKRMQTLCYEYNNLQSTCNLLAKTLISQGHKITHITTVLFQGNVIFTAVSRKDAFGLNEYNYARAKIVRESSPEETTPKFKLPSIDSLITECNLEPNLFYLVPI